MKSLTPTSKFKLLRSNELTTPGCCISCGNSSGEFIDFGYTVEFWGAAYFCVDTCFREAANTFDYISPEQHSKITIETALYKKENEELKLQVSEMKRVLATIVDNLSSTNSSGLIVDDATDSEEVVSTTESAVSIEQPIEQSTESTTNDSESESTRSIDEQGYTDVRNDDSLDKFLSNFDI